MQSARVFYADVSVLITGFALAETRLIKSLIDQVAERPERRGAVVVVSVTTNALRTHQLGPWSHCRGVARPTCRAIIRGTRSPTPLSMYVLRATGLAVWHAGLSGSAPLKATSEAQLTEILGADLASRIDPMLLENLGSALNLTVIISCLIVIITLFFLAPTDEADMQSATVPDNESGSAGRQR